MKFNDMSIVNNKEVMRKIWLILGFIFVVNQSLAQRPYIPNGGLFTPKGDIKALVIFVGFSHQIDQDGDSIPFNNQNYTNWDIKNGQNLPPYVNPITGDMEIFHNSISDYSHIKSPSNISDYYKEMSLGKFNFLAECFKDPETGIPKRIDIDAKGKNSIQSLNKAVVQKIYEDYPNFDWSPFDRRVNNPGYRKNASTFNPDGKPDCLIFVYRNHLGMPTQIFKQSRSGWGGGVATSFLSGYKSPWENITFDNMGFTLSDESGKNGDAFLGMFLHEIAHKLYNSPHYNGANGTIGNYFFYPDVSYGMMNSTNFTNVCANGWERWILGWINLDKQDSDKNRSIDSIDALEHSFILRDYVTSGDAIRLPIPFYPNSYLWIENHQNKSPIERNLFGGKVLSVTGDTVPHVDHGVYAYIERISPHRYFLPNYGNKFQSNGIRFMHADGNWDYEHGEDISRSWKTYYYNPIITLKKKNRNPFSGTNPFMRFVDDYPKGWNSKNNADGKIKYKSSIHGGYLESVPFILQTNGNDTIAIYGFSGGHSEKSKTVLKNHSPFFKDNEELSLSSGHPIYGLVKYNKKEAKLDPILLNGMHVDFKHIDKDAYLVTVKYNDFTISNDIRFSGNISLKHNYLDSLDYSLILNKKKVITVDKSGTVNTHKKTNDSFINPTQVTLESGSRLLMKRKSKIIIEDQSTFVIKKGAYLKMEPGSKVIIGKMSKLIIEDGAKIDKGKRSKIKQL